MALLFVPLNFGLTGHSQAGKEAARQPLLKEFGRLALTTPTNVGDEPGMGLAKIKPL